MIILAIDPGPERSAWCRFDSHQQLVAAHGYDANDAMLELFIDWQFEIEFDRLAIEWVESYGMAVGKDVFQTVRWIGRFEQAWYRTPVELVPRKAVKITLCNSMKAKDGNIRQALIDRFPATGGGKIPQIGLKASPGPLYGVSSHVWSALAVAVTAAERLKGE